MCALVTGVQTWALPILAKNACAIEVPEYCRKTVESDRPIVTAKPQNMICKVLVFIRAWPKLIANTKPRSEEHTSELQSPMRISYAVFCLKTTKKTNTQTH